MMNDKPLIGVGELSEVYAWQEGWVLKLFHTGMPLEYVEHERAVTADVRDAGLPVPLVGEVVTVDQRHGLLLEHIEGVSLLELWLGNLADYRPIIDLLATLQQQIHQAKSPSTLFPSQREWLYNNINDSDDIPPTKKQQFLATLAALPSESSLCHGDFHPNNILVRPTGEPVIIDWFSATLGSCAADVARTDYLIREAPLPESLAALLSPSLRQTAADHYRTAYTTPLDNFEQWRSVLQAATIWENRDIL